MDDDFLKRICNNLISYDKEIVEDAIKNKKPLFCIGYNLPYVDLSGKKFEASVYFENAIFHEDVKFIEAEFSGFTIFKKAEFKNIADFSRAKFSSEVSFYKTIFSSKSEFWKAKFFSAELSFLRLSFLK
ncbi:MAG: pentapeptide repeat-containing protein [Thermoproteota archaeon]